MVGEGMKRVVILLASLVVGAGFVIAVGFFFSRVVNPDVTYPMLAATNEGTVDTPRGPMPHAVLQVSSWADSEAGECHGPDGGEHPGWVTFCPTTNFQLPANSYVTIRVEQYDGGEVITNPYFAQVHGTADGAALLNGEKFTAIPPDTVGHTFTIRGIPSPDQDDMFVSVPLMASHDENVTPNVVEFSFYTGSPGTYYWNCEFPCGDGTYANFGGPMSAQGYMAGIVEVV